MNVNRNKPLSDNGSWVGNGSIIGGGRLRRRG